ncbi:MAG TPA: DEAD/DEAH box helicase family protein [Patescibacteria group bacterium]|nr:DEAD/DEAH box helicase family protein [Patescibacteria group bacterium]
MNEHDSENRIEIVQSQLRTQAVGNFSTYAVVTLDQLETMATEDTARLLFDILGEHPELDAKVEQAEALDAIKTARENDQRNALLQMATGLGKTTVVAADVRRFLEEKPNARIAFFCDQNDILDQARQRFEAIIGPNHTYGNFTGEGEKDLHEVTCLFASFQAMREWHVAFKPDEFDYIVVDESHHSKADTYEPTLRHFQPEFMLGITATPDRADLRDIRDIFGEEIYSLSLEEAIARGLLAEIDYRVLTEEVDLQAALRKFKGQRLTVKQLDRTLFIPKRNEEIVQNIIEHSQELDNPKRIIFCRSIEHTEEMAQYFEHAAPLHSKLPKWEQDEYIKRFREGSIDTLLTVDMFNEGIDIPDANQIVFLRTTASKTVFLQQLGRGLRRTRDKEFVQVLDFVANCDRLAMLNQTWKNIQHYQTEYSTALPEKVMRIDIGDMHFSEVARDILEILDDIEAQNFKIRNWTQQDSIDYYLQLKAELGRAPNIQEVESRSRRAEGPSFGLITRDFDGKWNNLRKAAGDKVKEFTKYTADELLDYMVEIIERTGKTPKFKQFMEQGGNFGQVKKHFNRYSDYVKLANQRWLQKRKEQ